MKTMKNTSKFLMLCAFLLSLSFAGCKKEKISPTAEAQRSLIPGGAVISAAVGTGASVAAPLVPGGAVISAKQITKLSASRIDQTPIRATNNMQNENRQFSTLSNP
jgi:hypothetical protein